MYAVLGWADGFGNDTVVEGIYKTRQKAIEATPRKKRSSYRIQKFEFGEIEFDYYEAKEIIRKKKVKRNGVFKNEIYQIFW